MNEDPDADALDAEAERLGERSEELGQRIDHVRSDWDAKKGDQSVPGAVEGAGDQQDDEDAG